MSDDKKDVIPVTALLPGAAKLIQEEKDRLQKQVMPAVRDAAQKHLGWPGAMVCGSKSYYYEKHPNHITVFNSNIVSKEHGKIWYGDIDLTVSEDQVKALAKELSVTVYVLREHDARFSNEADPKFDNAVYFTDGETAQAPDAFQKLKQIDGERKLRWLRRE